MNTGWFIKDNNQEIFIFCDYLKDTLGLLANELSFNQFVEIIRNDYRHKFENGQFPNKITGISGWVFPVHVPTGERWIHLNIVESKYDEQGYMQSFGYVQTIDNPEIMFQSGTSILRMDNLLEQLSSISRLLQDILRSDNYAPTINRILANIHTHFCAGRTYIYKYNWERMTQTNVYEKVEIYVKPQIEHQQNIPLDTSEWRTQEICAGRSIVISTLDELPREAINERTLLEWQNINSFFVAPIFSKEGICGYAGLDIIGGQYTWSPEDCEWLTTMFTILNLCIQSQSFNNDEGQEIS